jgi:predicted DNA-binding protein (MmcQ/YjbR family)
VNIEELRDYTLVFKVGGKIFLLCGLNDGEHFNAKCDPELAIDLREKHTEVQPGYHMNKTHWNTVSMAGGLSNKQLRDMVDHSYELVLKSLSKKLQADIAAGIL